MKSYLFSYDLSGLDFTQANMQAFIANNRHIYSWSYIFPGSYFLKSNADFDDLWQSLNNFLGGKRFVVAQIQPGPETTNGSITVTIWHWLNARAEGALNALLPYFKSEN